jgi:hypothetical protein
METGSTEQYFAHGYVGLWISSKWASHTSIKRQIVSRTRTALHKRLVTKQVAHELICALIETGPTHRQADGSIVDMYPSSPPRLMPPKKKTELFQL